MIYNNLSNQSLLDALDEYIEDPLRPYYHMAMMNEWHESDNASWLDIVESY